MSRSATAYRILSDSTHDTGDRDERVMLEAHVGPFALQRVNVGEGARLHANDEGALFQADDADDDEDRTLTVSAEENALLVRRAFADEEITREVAAPTIPAGVPSPLGDTGDPARAAPSAPGGPARLTSLFEDEDDKPTAAFTPAAPTVRGSVSPEAYAHVRAAREAARTAKARESRTRLLVLGIWGVAVTLGGLCAFAALTA
ncbi:MAG: hypothetical protein KF850_14905 [Labilithrix sp.]|nr:hypothetical protein [Labilithrix sp.]